MQFEASLEVSTLGPTYRLRGVTVHHGGAHAGHYTSYVRASDDCWYHCDDEQKPQRVSSNVVFRAQAYVLIYEREP